MDVVLNRLKDLCTAICNAGSKWEDRVRSSSCIVQELADSVIDYGEKSLALLDEYDDESAEKADDLPQVLEQIVESNQKINRTLEYLDRCVSELGSALDGLNKLRTWTGLTPPVLKVIVKLQTISGRMAAQRRDELRCKRAVILDIGGAEPGGPVGGPRRSKTVCKALCSAWVHEPFITSPTDLTVAFEIQKLLNRKQ